METKCMRSYAIVFEDKSGRVNRNTYKGLLNSAYSDTKVFKNDMKRVTFDEIDAVECRIKSAFLI